jgi:hypothetical protein
MLRAPSVLEKSTDRPQRKYIHAWISNAGLDSGMNNIPLWPLSSNLLKFLRSTSIDFTICALEMRNSIITFWDDSRWPFNFQKRRKCEGVENKEEHNTALGKFL